MSQEGITDCPQYFDQRAILHRPEHPCGKGCLVAGTADGAGFLLGLVLGHLQF